MTWATSPPPPVSLPPLSSIAEPLVREEHLEPVPPPEPERMSSPDAPSSGPSGHDLCPSHAGMEKQPIRGLGRLFRRHMLFFLIVQVAEISHIQFTNGRHMGSHFTYFGEGGEGVSGGLETRGRYNFSLY